MFHLPPPRRLSAFTLLEMMVVLAVSSILFTLAYAALGLVQRQQQVFAARSASLGQVSTWQNVLAADFKAAQRIEATDNQLRFQQPAGLVLYVLQDSTLLRQQGDVVDTLAVPVRACTYFWQGQPRAQGLVDEASLLLVAAHDTFYVQATAQYTAQQLLGDSLTHSSVPL